MFANFPGFLMADTGARQNTNIFRVPPGGGALVKTGGMPISQAIMPLPYKEPGPALMNLVTNMAETGARVGGTAEIMVGEGRQDAPVGTTLAMIEQATKVLNAVHKRLHSAQAEEFQLLVRCFREHPESFWQRCKRPTYDWNEQTFIQALNDCELVPQADPNTSSHTQRLMKIMALKQLQAANPGMYDPIAIDTAALKAMGWSNPEQFLAPPAAQSAPPPELIQAQAQMQTAQMRAEAAMLKAQTDAQAAAMRMQVDQARAQADMMRAETDRMAADAGAQIDMLNAETNLMKAQAEAQLAFGELGSKAADRAQKERMNLIDLAQNVAVHPYSAELVAPLVQPALQEISEQEQEERSGGIMPRT